MQQRRDWIVEIRRLGQPGSQRDYWLGRPAAERVAMVESLRREFHGWRDEPEPRLERVYRVVKR